MNYTLVKLVESSTQIDTAAYGEGLVKIFEWAVLHDSEGGA